MLVEHAKRELELAGLFKEDSSYNGEIAKNVMELMEKFAEQGHSGGSAYMTLEIFELLAKFKSLTPITNNPDEWMEVGTDMWQNRRSYSVFSKDGGQTWYDIDDPKTNDTEN